MAKKPNGVLIRLPIVHELGDSERHVLSQKAATVLYAGKVDNTVKINGHQLTGDVDISASDVGAFSKAETNLALDGKIDRDELVHVLGDSAENPMSQKGVTDALKTAEAGNNQAFANLESKVNEHTNQINVLTGRVSSLENNKADKSSVYTKAESDGKFATRTDVENSGGGYKQGHRIYRVDNHYLDTKSLRGRLLTMNFLRNGTVTTVVPWDVDKWVVVSSIDSQTSAEAIRMELNANGMGVLISGTPQEVWVSK